MSQSSAFSTELIQAQLSSHAPDNDPSAAEQPSSVSTLLEQLAQSLAVFSTVSAVSAHADEQMLVALRTWLQPHARRIEKITHQLHDQGVLQGSLGNEILQSTTVLVLIADLLIANQCSSLAESCTLLQRNTSRAVNCLFTLSRQYPPMLEDQAR